MRRRCKRCGQSTLEYLIILCAIVAAVMIARAVVQGNVENSLNTAGTAIERETTTLLGSAIN